MEEDILIRNNCVNKATEKYEKAWHVQLLTAVQCGWRVVCEWGHIGTLSQGGIRDPVKNDLCYNRKFELNSLGSGRAIKIFKQENNRMAGTVDVLFL